MAIADVLLKHSGKDWCFLWLTSNLLISAWFVESQLSGTLKGDGFELEPTKGIAGPWSSGRCMPLGVVDVFVVCSGLDRSITTLNYEWLVWMKPGAGLLIDWLSVSLGLLLGPCCIFWAAKLGAGRERGRFPFQWIHATGLANVSDVYTALMTMLPRQKGRHPSCLPCLPNILTSPNTVHGNSPPH